MTIPNNLPQPPLAAIAHSERLLALIKQQISAAGGAISFRRFMELALYAPGLGYYVAGAWKFGAAGDFVTAPEISPLFSRCLARQCRQILQQTGGDILELGAGSGVMAADILAELEILDCLPKRYLILDLGTEARIRQQALLEQRMPHLARRVEWLSALPQTFRGVILGNEVVDAMPVERFCITESGAAPLEVAWSDRGLIWHPGAVDRDSELQRRLDALQDALGYSLASGYCSEYNPLLDAWVQALAHSLEYGAILLLDYGNARREYYHPQRCDGSLRCFYRHYMHDDPLLWPGLQDISADVDFSALADAAIAAGLEISGYTSQAYFLFGCDLEDMVAESDPTDTARHLQRMQQIKRLTLPGEMGERCKVIALTRHLSQALHGFSFTAYRGQL